ncbi:MAG: HD domain-containing protein [Oscillospiraceae bacterium]
MKSIKQCQIGELCVPEDSEYIDVVRDILENEKFCSMKNFIQHGETTCLTHSINVSYLSYMFCKAHNLNANAAARGGLLHDLFLYNWHNYHRKKGERLHGFEHPRKALENAECLFPLTDIERNIILRHMWPLTITPPKYKEALCVVYYDKYCSVMEALYLPVFELLNVARVNAI